MSPTPWPARLRRGLLAPVLSFWSDVGWADGWRVQEHVAGGVCRLLDDRGRTVAAGTEADCRRALAERRPPAPAGRRYVVLLHGLGRLRSSMEPLARHLAATTGLTPVNVSYASTDGTIDEHAARLGRLIATLDSPGEVSFVAHSMGNLVIRRYFQRTPPGDRPAPGRMVMIGPPNRGSALARLLQSRALFRGIAGRGGLDIAGLEVRPEALGIPDLPFAIVVGGTGGRGFNPLLPGDDDLIVTTAEADLPGAADRMRVFGLHAVLMRRPSVMDATARFLTTGRLTGPLTQEASKGGLSEVE